MYFHECFKEFSIFRVIFICVCIFKLFFRFEIGPLKGSGAMCLQFFYNMYGDDIGYLQVDAVYNTALSQTSTTLFRTGRFSQEEWLNAAVTVKFGNEGVLSVSVQLVIDLMIERDLLGSLFNSFFCQSVIDFYCCVQEI